MLRLLLSILFIFYLGGSAYACSAAYQYSLFPLGSTGGQLVILETELNRYLTSPDNQMIQMGGGMPLNGGRKMNLEVRWKGTLKVYILQNDSMVLSKKIGFVDLLDEEYQAHLKPYFNKAMNHARGLPFFSEASLIKTGYCHYDRSCTFMDLTILEDSTRFLINLGDSSFRATKFEVPFRQTTLEKFQNMTKLQFTEFKSVDKESQLGFFQMWSPQTARLYDINGQQVIVYTLGWGNRTRYTFKKAANWDKKPQDISNFVLGNDVMMHGQRFDFIQKIR